MTMTKFLRLPRLKLRGTIIAAAATLFSVSLIASLFFVVSTTRTRDLAQADEAVGGLARNEAGKISNFLGHYATAAEAIASTFDALYATPEVSLAVYGEVLSQQMQKVDDALSMTFMFDPETGLHARPAFAGSSFLLPGNHVGISAERGQDGAVTLAPPADPAPGGYGWFHTRLEADRSAITGPSPHNGLLYTSFFTMIRDNAGKGIGTAIVSFDTAKLASTLGATQPMGSGFLGILSQDGIWVFNPDSTLIGTPADQEWALNSIEALKLSDTHNYTSEAAGETWKVTAVKAPIPGLDDQNWTVIIAVPQATLLAASEAQLRDLLIGAGIVFAIGLGGFALLGTWVAKPVSKMNGVMLKIADGAFDVEVPYGSRKDEIGDMSKAVEVFRQNGQRVAQMTEAEAARIVRDQEARAGMMADLQRSFGQVVDSAVAGDFSRRVDAEFPDAELNALASSVNNLVATVDRGLSETGEVLAALADTDLTKRMQGDYHGAFAQLKNDTNAVADKLSVIVGQLKETSRGLKTATGEILSGANDLSERTTKQAATIEETSAAMEQLATTVLQNADRAKEASTVASSVTRTAEEGGKVMGEANSAMERITASSAKISNIIGLIDDIAFQTNLLALNASVEAARAGDAGKGFAVVAVEVRRLAQSAASASSEVKVLIDQSSGEVKTGSKLVADAAARLEAMLEAARSSNALMDGIARESREQASAIEEVNTAVRQLDEMTQHNAALVEQTNAAIEQTEAQANELDRVVDIFTVSGTAPVVQSRPTVVRSAPAKGIKGLQEKVKKAASSYLSRGNAAIDKDWAEF